MHLSCFSCPHQNIFALKGQCVRQSQLHFVRLHTRAGAALPEPWHSGRFDSFGLFMTDEPHSEIFQYQQNCRRNEKRQDRCSAEAEGEARNDGPQELRLRALFKKKRSKTHDRSQRGEEDGAEPVAHCFASGFQHACARSAP